ncbi:MAG TPA: D-ribose pyranase [Gaiellaceae bacterium]|nr:D-ribose pyranase [Gaiellaceae bacterium]
MKRSGILNPGLCRAIASLGHGDVLMVVDAGFPIPASVDRIDLAIAQDFPDLRSVLSLVHSEFIAENVTFAAEMAENNPLLHAWLLDEFADTEFEAVPHTEMLTTMAASARTVVRTGAFDPWGNIALRSGVDVPRWFTKDGVRVPEYYRERMTAGG